MKANLEKILNEDLGTSYFSTDLEEESIRYSMILNYICDYGLHDSVIGTKFTDKEILEAEILCFTGGRAFSYPHPEEPKFLENTYLNSCGYCGAFGKQKTDFVIKKEPNLKYNSVVSLHWAFGEIFCNSDSYKDFFKKLGLEYRPVIVKKENQPSESVVQVVLPLADSELRIKEVDFTKCSHCGRIKYTPNTIGFFPQPEDENFSIMNTQEFFGSGHSAAHRILLTNDVMKEMIKSNMAKKHQFVPCKKKNVT
ncbi:hypothetical protein DBR11_25405 [Pedobacter sp. HMWF019]|uniref:hypothetical protein n=1 Tax=Pedobacter sp. HMWF019 TaxID=2056856 RepID=UPI000D34FE2D|nr:hypothetical protein [Pedobacter sp. HMWF019]PTS93383.1 hypothetical protein DBR11_25405 [Pedobacter sp. HMWF019]